MRHVKRHLRLATPALALVISACATVPGPTPATGASEQPPASKPEPAEPVVAEPPDTRHAPSRPKPGPCAWTDVRGIAKLLALTGKSGTWQFFPGDDVLFHTVPTGARPDDEFKALLRRPLNGACADARLILFDPV